MSAVFSREVKIIEEMTVGQLLDQCEYIETSWANIVGGTLPKNRREKFNVDMSALINIIAEQRLKDRGISV